jgi:DNA segregation ATPase FtsK/SpoIIIE, S-DNA-T family
MSKLLLVVLVLVPLAAAVRGGWGAWRFLGLPAEARRQFCALAAAAVAMAVVAMCRYWVPVVLAAAVLDGLALAVTAARVALLPSGARRYWPLARWYRLGWKRLACNLWIAYPDQFRATADSWLPGKVLYPRARFRPDPGGFTVAVRTIPGVGRLELEKSARFLADHWRAARVSVSQPGPGRMLLRAHRTDPLLEVLDVMPPGRGLRYLYLGRDECGAHRWADLANVPGIVVGGMPGAGKSTEVTGWQVQLAPSPAVQFVNLDGKNAGEFADLEPRAWLTGGDDLDEALGILEIVHGLMTDRLACVRQVLGTKNAWQAGPTADWPLVMTTIDECQQYFDLSMVKGDRNAEPKVRRCIFLASSLIRRGRSVAMITVPATQKPTGDSVPTAIRDNCPLAMSFAVRTVDAAVATLGSAIRDFVSYSPAGLALPDYTGVATVTLRTGQDPFTRLRGPMVTEDQAAAAAAASAHLRKDPRVSLPVVVPDDASSLAGA